MKIIPEGSGATTKYYAQLGADAASKKLLGSAHYGTFVFAPSGATRVYHLGYRPKKMVMLVQSNTFNASLAVVYEDNTIKGLSYNTYEGSVYYQPYSSFNITDDGFSFSSPANFLFAETEGSYFAIE